MSSSLADPIAQHSGPISAYMKGHTGANLAYARYFGGIDNAVSASFESLTSQGFTVSYVLPDSTQGEVFIRFAQPLSKREDIRIVLEAMAKEAEEALGMPSSLNGPPPIAALMKAQMAEENEPVVRPNPVYGEADNVPRDVFFPAHMFWQVAIAAGMAGTATLTYASDAFLARQFPSFVLQLRRTIGHDVIRVLWTIACTAHISQGILALYLCVKRGWYHPVNIAKWTFSTLLYGYASTKKLLKHGRDVSLEEKQK
ncbi:uncharacterized protein BYT42DRAFT_572203 [Radiomyces spectabilis]|uniref:uncharacterized protein n=1 Tax=Radiomyces spectabilis TaxID=64574 RepID=UPI0022210E30|nr:uncharacterized protein BYT42DRAFT_572203 [Radiomyces spectabilis]KAI8377926.1 hypothetical protein BYT42DRAFT_572203 [Radiomyces spectabilis]